MSLKNLLITLLLLFAVCMYAGEPLRIGVITDIHYLSESLMEDGKVLEDYINASGKNIKDTPEVLDKVITHYLDSDIQVLLICGDLTKDGEKQSHQELVNKLKPLHDNGVRIFVIPGNHDINMPNSSAYMAGKKIPVPNITPQEFTAIYADFGYNQSIQRDPNGLSYTAALDDKTWLLAIDAARYKEYTERSITAGKISKETEDWIVKMLDDAKAQGIQVIGMMHWGLTEHIIYQSLFFKDYLVDDWQRLANLFADKGMKAIFTGHFHSNDISEFVSEKGHKIYDIETGTLSSYPFSYRFVDLYPDRMNITTKNIESIPGNPELAKTDKARMQTIAKVQASQKLKSFGIELTPEVSASFAEVLSRIFVMHAFGDEKPDDELLSAIKQLSEAMDSPMDTDDIQLDFPPADNNLEIRF